MVSFLTMTREVEVKGISVSVGNMYDWVTHMWSQIIGCPHQCSYCYVANRFRDQPAEVTLKDFWPPLGSGRVYFVGHLCDMFAEVIPTDWIVHVLDWCRHHFDNEYVFQTKNPSRVLAFLDRFPPRHMIGTTIETNRQDILESISRAPAAVLRSFGLSQIPGKKFLTIEPIMDFDVPVLVALVGGARPDFVNIGADSKHHGLPEPSRQKVLALIDGLQAAGVTIRKKCNLERLTA